MTPFAKSVVASTATLLALLAVERAHPANGITAIPKAIQREVREWVYHGANADDELGLLAGYYDELLNASRDTIHAGNTDDLWDKALARGSTQERLESFLLYRPKPSLGDPADPTATVVTNRAGLFDRDYPEARTPGVRRLVWVGDSLSRGLGAPFGQALEPNVERWLNESQVGDGVVGFELMNLAVEGYRTTQFVKVVEEALPRFHPDVVVVGLSDLSVTRIWGHHLACLVHDGIDLEYPYLRELAARAALKQDDAPTVTDAKLAPFSDEFVRWALATMQQSCRAGGAELAVVLLPAVGEVARLEARFEPARAALGERGIVTLDLVSTFADVPDLRPLRVSDIDHHPNPAGYQLLFERFKDELLKSPVARALITGRAGSG
ncbi:MAG: SGNH/GDSL hydrolase family protein [Planctomycetes bacterium]|nr:SGNH/GDSL hydrolase family protein [Planctomycetota bacterium]